MRVRKGHGYVTENLFVASLDPIEESLEFLGPFAVDRSFSDTSVKAPCELMTGVNLGDVLHLTTSRYDSSE